MKRIKRYVAIGCTLLLVAVPLTACSKSKESTNDNTNVSTTEDTTLASTTVYGKVTAIDGNVVTLALGELSQSGMGGAAPSGQPPQMPNGNSTGGAAPSGTPNGDMNNSAVPSQTPGDTSGAAVPSGTPGASDGGAAPSGMPGGNPPSGGIPGSMRSSFTENGETLTITVEDEGVIQVQSGSSTTQGSIADITVDAILQVQYAEDGSISAITVQSSAMAAPGGMGGGSMSGSETGSITLTGAYTVDGITETSDSQTIEATESNQNAVLVKNGGSLTITGATLNKTGDTSSADESNFYAVNSILAAVGGSSANVSDTTLTSASEGSNAIFASGEGSNITVSNVTVNTSGNSSRGLDATYGGTITADHVNITTTGAHCAPIATDRGEGTITVTDSTVSASGDGSPCIYSTGNITVTNLTGKATGSQAAVVEGKNSITINSSNITGAGLNGVMLYQSTSGDAAEGACKFTVNDSTITTTSTGEMFYITNTSADIYLTNSTLNFTSGILLNAAGNSTNNWGTPGSNGATVSLTGSNQVLKGDITCDDISSVTMNLTQGTSLTGAIDNANTGDVTITLDADSTWNVTADSYVTAITDTDNSLANVVSNGFTIYYDATNSANSWLNGATISLADGGTLAPIQ
ncbi:MAG TPA: hypothetical protein VN258_11855 [Mobilitalea sp.]|nr:hypothetical protein [Mobilitalea sp.]